MTGIPTDAVRPGETLLLAGVASGSEALALADLAGLTTGGRDVLFVASDDMALARTQQAMAFFAPEVTCLEFPAWDCLPYDRVSPLAAIVGQRLHCLGQL